MDIEEKRWIMTINFARTFSMGSLWWIKNALWREKIEGFDRRHLRGRHPAICLGVRKIESLSQTIPMSLGSHAIRQGFEVGKLNSREKTTKKSHFRIWPYHFAVSHTLGSDPGIEKNNFKPQLTASEVARLKTSLIRQGIRFEE